MLRMDSVVKISNSQTWQQELSGAFTQLDKLLAYLNLDINDLEEHERANKLFPLLVTRSFASQINKNDPLDPLLKQVLPLPAELDKNTLFTNDPVGDDKASILPGLIHKYYGRVLLIVTGACAIHCRYCFRRAFPYADNSSTPAHFEKVLTYLENHKEIEEVILSGGDPLTISDQRLANIIEAIQSIKHIKRLRIHTRLPVVLPNRVTNRLIDIIKNTSLKTIFVLHVNHPQELSDDVERAIYALKKAKISLFNQTVLLKGVNDNPKTLIDLSYKLFDNDIQPYYLHLLDKVDGAAHFDLAQKDALVIYKKVQQKLPGYLVPKLVTEVQGEANKTLIT